MKVLVIDASGQLGGADHETPVVTAADGLQSTGRMITRSTRAACGLMQAV